MIRKSLLILLLMFGSMVFANDWEIQEMPYENYVYYVIKEAPAEYENLIDSMVCSSQSRIAYRNVYLSSCKEEILEYLKNGDFEIGNNNNAAAAFLPVSFLQTYFPEVLETNIPVSKDDLDFIWEKISTKYAGFSDMKKRGFSKKQLYKIKNTQELKILLDKYVEDCHFQLRVRDFFYDQETAHDKGSKKSLDPSDIYFEKETSNAYYVRFTNCTPENTAYFQNMPAVSFFAKDKDFIILDARSNSGGSETPQFNLRKSLDNIKYKGTVIVLQDNWSFSSGEVWHTFGVDGLRFKCLLVGTHSGGMQNYGNCEAYTNENLNMAIYFGSTNFRKYLSANYLGDGKGYEPDVWATTETMASVLTGLGVDVTGIEFK